MGLGQEKNKDIKRAHLFLGFLQLKIRLSLLKELKRPKHIFFV